MNYRHQFHAANFADVAKHMVLLALVEAMQRKPRGFLFLDTHAGSGAYDLQAESRGDSRERQPEWPEGWGRVRAARDESDLPASVRRYLEAVEAFAADHSAAGGMPYPGSPLLVVPALRPVDRAVLCELQGDEQAALAARLGGRRRVRVEQRDGYEAVRGCLPPLERRALVLIDPPYEAEEESERVATALQEALRRLPGATIAVWYPLTERAGSPRFLDAIRPGSFPPSWTAELTVAGPASTIRMRGAGLVVINPPWQADQELAPAMTWLGRLLAREDGAAGTLRWLVSE